MSSRMTNSIVAVIVALFVCGAILPSALVLISNATAYSGVDPTVITIATVLLPMLSIVSIAMIILSRR